jgi:hypothetical protein
MKYLFSIILAFISAVIMFELFLSYSPYDLGTSAVEYDSTIGMWHKKNYTGKTVKECYSNEYSFDEQGRPKSIFEYDKKREDVILLGDSFTEAIMVRNDAIIHNSLAKEYHHKYNFLNYGLSDTSPVQQFIILKSKVDLSHVKYVIQIINLDSDLKDVDSKYQRPLSRPRVYIDFKDIDMYKIIPPRKQTLYDKFGDMVGDLQMYFYLKKGLYYFNDKLTATKKGGLIDQNKTDMSKSWLYLTGAIHQENKYLKEKDSKIVYKLVINAKLVENKRIIEEFLKREKIDFIFTDELFSKQGMEIKSYPCDKHWNEETHANVAKALHAIDFIQ